MKTPKYWIESLDLLPHPEGGFFKEAYRSSEVIENNSLPNRFDGDRSISTSIYFLLKEGQFSTFHKIKSDETWHFYDGAPITIYIINQQGNMDSFKLGLDPLNNIFPQITIPANCWFAAKSEGSFTLVGCTVAPGFDFNDFEMANQEELINEFPSHKSTILQFTKSC